jgi:hypothetical protein
MRADSEEMPHWLFWQEWLSRTMSTLPRHDLSTINVPPLTKHERKLNRPLLRPRRASRGSRKLSYVINDA